jgi:hypothetical protein
VIHSEEVLNYLPIKIKLGETLYFAKLTWRLPALFVPIVAILSAVLNTKLVNMERLVGLCLQTAGIQYQHV